MSRRFPARGAFTLIELVVTLVIIGMLAVVAAPALRARGGSAAAAAKELASVYEAAREMAITGTRGTVVEVDLASGSYRVLAEERPGQPTDTLRAAKLALSGDGRLSSRSARHGEARVRFDVLGRAHGDDVVLIDGKGRHAVVANPWTGAAGVAAY